MAEESFQEKTEQPTPKKLREATEKGNVAKSAELNSVVVLFLGTLLLLFTTRQAIATIQELFDYIFLDFIPSFSSVQDFSNLLNVVIKAVTSILLPFFSVLVLGSLIAGIAQTGFIFSTESITPKIDKISPLKGFKRLFSLRAVVDLVKNLIKLTIVGIVVYLTLVTSPERYLSVIYEGTGGILNFLGGTLSVLMIRVIVILLLLAILDFAYQKWQWKKDLRMTKQEVKEEHKQTEGDPLIKSRVRSLQYQMARSRMMQMVPEADVVITNPTHYAVALKYDYEKMSAPTCVAKGQRKLAERIKAIARENNIPIYENPPLARALFQTLEVGEEIPVQFYHVIAQILAEVYKMKRSA